MNVKIVTTKKDDEEIEQATYRNCELSISNIGNEIFIYIEYKR